MSRLRSRLLLLLAATALALLLAEATCRVGGWGDPLSSHDLVLKWSPDTPYRADPDPRIRLSLKAGWTGTQSYHRATDGQVIRQVSVRTNSAGLRGPSPQPGSVLLLGDSIVFGQGVEEDQALPAVLARTLGRPVVNAGVPTWDLDQETRWLETRGLELAPSLVLQAFYVNDLLPTLYFAGTEPIPNSLTRTAPPWARREGGLRRLSWAFNLGMRVVEQERRVQELRMEAWRGVPRSYLADIRSGWRDERITRAFRDLKQVCITGGVPCITVILPVFEPGTDGEATDLLDRASQDARDGGLQVLRLDDVLASLDPLDRWVEPGDPHPSVAAHQLMGTALARRLKEALHE